MERKWSPHSRNIGIPSRNSDRNVRNQVLMRVQNIGKNKLFARQCEKCSSLVGILHPRLHGRGASRVWWHWQGLCAACVGGCMCMRSYLMLYYIYELFGSPSDCFGGRGCRAAPNRGCIPRPLLWSTLLYGVSHPLLDVVRPAVMRAMRTRGWRIG
jgi:hypothetical protein